MLVWFQTSTAGSTRSLSRLGAPQEALGPSPGWERVDEGGSSMSVSGIASSSELVSSGLASARLSTRVVFETVRARYLELRTSLNM